MVRNQKEALTSDFGGEVDRSGQLAQAEDAGAMSVWIRARPAIHAACISGESQQDRRNIPRA